MYNSVCTQISPNCCCNFVYIITCDFGKRVMNCLNCLEETFKNVQSCGVAMNHIAMRKIKGLLFPH